MTLETAMIFEAVGTIVASPGVLQAVEMGVLTNASLMEALKDYLRASTPTIQADLVLARSSRLPLTSHGAPPDNYFSFYLRRDGWFFNPTINPSSASGFVAIRGEPALFDYERSLLVDDPSVHLYHDVVVVPALENLNYSQSMAVVDHALRPMQAARTSAKMQVHTPLPTPTPGRHPSHRF